jgi:cyclopropane-fatty-acyl-phospholipid synthase
MPVDAEEMRAQICEIFQGGGLGGQGFTLRWWDGRTDQLGESSAFTVHFRSKDALTALCQSIALGEGYMAGEIEVEGDLGLALIVCLWPLQAVLAGSYPPAAPSENLPERAKDNVARHYDLGNEFFGLWLDESRTYSCAYFASPTMTLEQAQLAKLDHVCRKLQLNPGESLLDVGCGWGSLIFRAVEEHGARAHGITLSEEQCSYVESEIRRRGLADRCSVSLVDYRSISGTYDKIASIGMFEHVGPPYYDAFMRSMTEHLKGGGLMLLHTIGIAQPKPPDPWVIKYIFPGGQAPLLSQIVTAAEGTDLVTLDVENLRLHYKLTLDEWLKRFEARLPEVERLGFGPSFVRMWRLFLTLSSAAFAYGGYHLYQVLFSKGARNDHPMTRASLYTGASE